MFTLGRAVWKISRACGLKCHNNGMSNGVDHADGGVAERKSILKSSHSFYDYAQAFICQIEFES